MHDGIKSLDMICCPFCNEIISERLVKHITCCKKDLFNGNGKNAV